MMLKIVCQICGTTRTINTEAQVGLDHPGWDNHELALFGVEGSFDDYEIWICGSCKSKTIIAEYPSYDEDGSQYYETEYDWDKLTDMVQESLSIQVFNNHQER